MHIAVVLPAYNVAAFLGDAIRSVLAQTHPDWSLIVVDDGSKDGTPAVAAEFQDPRIQTVRQANAGVSAARNVGISLASTSSECEPDALLFLDGDDWLDPDALALLARTLDDAPWAVAAVGRYARVSINGSVHRAASCPEGSLLERLLTRNLFANGGHLLIRREAIEAAGRFRQDLSYGEDWEYWTRLALLGEFAAVKSHAPLLFVRERFGGASLSRAADSTAYQPAILAIFANAALALRLGMPRLRTLRQQADGETAWSIGRELIRHGRFREGLRWLLRSVWRVPSLRRIGLISLFWAGFGPFRPYRLPN